MPNTYPKNRMTRLLRHEKTWVKIILQAKVNTLTSHSAQAILKNAPTKSGKLRTHIPNKKRLYQILRKSDLFVVDKTSEPHIWRLKQGAA